MSASALLHLIAIIVLTCTTVAVFVTGHLISAIFFGVAGLLMIFLFVRRFPHLIP